MKNILYTIILLVLTSCQKKIDTPVLFGNISITGEKNSKVKLSELFGTNYRIIPLETKEESLVGQINKIKKYNNQYYILTSNHILFHFDENGKFISSLNKRGKGPEEYLSIEDFDVYPNGDKTEIWLTDFTKIKIYNSTDLSFLRTINFPFVVHKFKRINNDRLLLMTGQNEKSLTLCNDKGDTIKTFLDKEVPFLTLKPIQFTAFHSKLIFPLGMSNGFVSYNPENDSFEKGIYTTKDNLLPEQELTELYAKHGIDYLGEIKNYTYIRNFVQINEKTYIDLYIPSKRCITAIRNGNATTVQYAPENNIINDLFDSGSSNYLTSIGMGESENSLILYIDSQDLENSKNIKDKDGNTITVSPEDNPLLLEFY